MRCSEVNLMMGLSKHEEECEQESGHNLELKVVKAHRRRHAYICCPGLRDGAGTTVAVPL